MSHSNIFFVNETSLLDQKISNSVFFFNNFESTIIFLVFVEAGTIIIHVIPG
jgi:hypothetical protein